MNTQNKKRETETDSSQEPYRFTKRLGSTTFLVRVYSSRTNTETANDKIIRLIRNDAELGKAANL